MENDMTSGGTPHLALAMIVRDEAEQLPGFLKHHHGLADEIVVVDTGSHDNTRQLAAAGGALVVDHPWQEDFAAARNAGLQAVSAPWVIFLDADEKLSPADFPALRAALATSPDCVFLQETWNYCPDGAHLEWQPLSGRYRQEEAGQTGMFVARRVGVFPRLDRLVFSGRVHESVMPAASALGLPLVNLDLPIHHYGYVRGAAINAARHQRYRQLVELKHKDNPEDPAAQLEWATVLLESGEPQPALEILEQLGGGPRGLRPVVRGLFLQGRLRREMGELGLAEALLKEAIAQDPSFIFSWLEMIRTAAQAQNWPAAAKTLAAAEEHFGAQNPQLLRESLRVKIKTGQLPEALAAAQELACRCPQWNEIHDLHKRLQGMVGRR